MGAVGSGWVLLVEDDPEVSRGLARSLRARGLEVQTVENGAVALELLHRGEHPGVILLDLTMPVMNGWQFIEALRADLHLRALPVVVLTAHPMDPRNATLDVASIVMKPPDFDHLVALVRGLLAG
ncbi:MAG: response regulator [Deltaproteobacteria bacterium]|nr:response regulator [Deltaproteobacteria bacterium]